MKKKSKTKAAHELRYGLTALLFLFVTLKLAEIGSVANWSWWFVLSPMWIPIPLAIVAYFILIFLRKRATKAIMYRLDQIKKKQEQIKDDKDPAKHAAISAEIVQLEKDVDRLNALYR